MDRKTYQNDEFARTLHHDALTVYGTDAMDGNRQPYGPLVFMDYSAITMLHCVQHSLRLEGRCLVTIRESLVLLPNFLDRFERVSETASGAGFWKGLMTAMIDLGALIGAINQGWIADKISRSYSIIVTVFFFTIGSVLQTAAVDYPMLVVGRFIGGVGIGMLSMVAPLYISEISPPEIRGALLILEELSIVFGIVGAFWITYGTRFISGEWAWRFPFLLQLIPGLVLGMGILFLPFSPRWLASKGRNKEALRSLCKLRQLPCNDARVLRERYDIRAKAAFRKVVSIFRHTNLQQN